jgi:hypothetical protein
VNSAALSFEDERAIRSLVFRYAYAVSRADADALESAWAKDCRFELAGVSGEARVLQGRDTVVSYQREHMGWYDSLVQLVGEGLVWAGPDGVEGRWIVWEVGHWSGRSTDRMGIVVYADRYVQENGRWVFGARRLNVHYNNTELPAGTYVPLPELPS